MNFLKLMLMLLLCIGLGSCRGCLPISSITSDNKLDSESTTYSSQNQHITDGN